MRLRLLVEIPWGKGAQTSVFRGSGQVRWPSAPSSPLPPCRLQRSLQIWFWQAGPTSVGVFGGGWLTRKVKPLANQKPKIHTVREGSELLGMCRMGMCPPEPKHGKGPLF